MRSDKNHDRNTHTYESSVDEHELMYDNEVSVSSRKI